MGFLEAISKPRRNLRPYERERERERERFLL